MSVNYCINCSLRTHGDMFCLGVLILTIDKALKSSIFRRQYLFKYEVIVDCHINSLCKYCNHYFSLTRGQRCQIKVRYLQVILVFNNLKKIMFWALYLPLSIIDKISKMTKERLTSFDVKPFEYKFLITT